MLNNIGPRTYPCGTPLSNANHELKLVFNLYSLPMITNSVLFVRNSYQSHMHLILLIVTHG